MLSRVSPPSSRPGREALGQAGGGLPPALAAVIGDKQPAGVPLAIPAHRRQGVDPEHFPGRIRAAGNRLQPLDTLRQGAVGKGAIGAVENLQLARGEHQQLAIRPGIGGNRQHRLGRRGHLAPARALILRQEQPRARPAAGAAGQPHQQPSRVLGVDSDRGDRGPFREIVRGEDREVGMIAQVTGGGDPVRSGEHQLPVPAVIAGAVEAIPAGINHRRAGGVPGESAHPAREIVHPPGLAAIDRDIGPGHVAADDDFLRVPGVVGRVESGAAAARTNHLPCRGRVVRPGAAPAHGSRTGPGWRPKPAGPRRKAARTCECASLGLLAVG